MKLLQIISEIQFKTYQGMVQVVYKDINVSKVAEIIRALPGVTTVTIAGDGGNGRVVLKIKLISQKSGIEAFKALSKNATTKYLEIKVVKVGETTIEEK